jgi:transposase-like protein
MLTFGAHRYRCKPCRYNFLSFRPRLLSSNRPAGGPEPERQQALADSVIVEGQNST